MATYGERQANIRNALAAKEIKGDRQWVSRFLANSPELACTCSRKSDRYWRFLRLMALGAVCAMARQKTAPDILRMLQNQAPAMHKASANHASPGAVKREFRSSSPVTE